MTSASRMLDFTGKVVTETDGNPKTARTTDPTQICTVLKKLGLSLVGRMGAFTQKGAFLPLNLRIPTQNSGRMVDCTTPRLMRMDSCNPLSLLTIRIFPSIGSRARASPPLRPRRH